VTTVAAAVARRPNRAAVVACLIVAVASLAVPTALAFDAWAWLVWGREVLHLELDTTGGPSWKPLPVLITTPLALLGGLAPVAWLVATRTLGLLAVVLTYRLATRLAGLATGVLAAGVLAVVGLLLGPDGGPRFLRLVAEGHSAPAEAALALWAIESHLDHRERRTLVLLTGLSLLRPEAWPFLGFYALWACRRRPGDRPLVVGLLVAVPVLWFGADWWGSGSPLHGARDAQVIDDPVGERLLDALDHVAKVVVVPLWVGVGAALLSARHRGEQTLLVLGAAAFAWMAIVVTMSVGLRYAALSRFLLPAAAVLCVLGGVGLVRLLAATRPGLLRIGAVAGLVLLSVPFAGPRIAGFGALVDGVSDRAVVDADLADLVDAVGRDALTACGRVVADPADLPQARLAWHLRVPMHDVDGEATTGPHVAVVGPGGPMERRLLGTGASVERLAGNEHWTAYAVDCPAAVSS